MPGELPDDVHPGMKHVEVGLPVATSLPVKSHPFHGMHTASGCIEQQPDHRVLGSLHDLTAALVHMDSNSIQTGTGTMSTNSQPPAQVLKYLSWVTIDFHPGGIRSTAEGCGSLVQITMEILCARQGTTTCE